MLITADHGNAEKMYDPRHGQPHTAHTLNLVPLALRRPRGDDGATAARSQDVAPTLLAMMGLPQPSEMTGRSLLELSVSAHSR